MADTKISALTAAGPLAGTEVVPGVQSGSNVKITASAIAALAPAGATGANPTATASDTAVNGSAATFMRSDAAPAIQKATSGQFGLVEVDGTTITAASGIITAAATGWHPGFKTGRYYTRSTGVNLTSLAITANRLYAVPFFVPVNTTFTKMAIYTVTGASSTAVELGIYNNSNGAPGSLKQDVGNVTSTASATKTELTGKTITLVPGWYWLALGGNGTPTLRAAASNDYNSGILGFSGPDQSSPYTGLYGAWTYSVGGLPDPFPALAGGIAGIAEIMPLPWIGL